MDVVNLATPEVKLIKPQFSPDACGFFQHIWHEKPYRAAGLDVRLVQDNRFRCSGQCI
ncbi:MAG: hypothetical protein WC334_09490 [Kiritimatiellales bacterium]|jgi:dTDP-4-dehydrorhamnose 3,5-epimerase-like enzyme